MTDAATRSKPFAYHGILLGVVALVCSALLNWGFVVTKHPIEQRTAEDTEALLRQVIPVELYDNALVQDATTLTLEGEAQPLLVYRARKNQTVTAVAFQAETQGYGGTITMLIGISAKAEILGVRVIAHSETPGLGDKIDSKKTDWVLEFNGKSLYNTEPGLWKVKKDGGIFDQFSGATITPRAVVKGVVQALNLFQHHRDRFLGTDQTG